MPKNLKCKILNFRDLCLHLRLEKNIKAFFKLIKCSQDLIVPCFVGERKIGNTIVQCTPR